MAVTAFTEANKPKTQSFEDQTVVTASTTPGPPTSIVSGAFPTDKTNNSQDHVYQYGIKNIGLSYSLYEQTGAFVTKPIEVEGNIVEVALSADEEHPLFDELDGMATDQVTSTEYYISFVDSPSVNDWIAILPEGQTVVKEEKLFFQGSSAALRFHADISDTEHTKVYKNNLVMDSEDWYFTGRGASIQLSVVPESGAIYAMDYVPDTALFNPWTVEIDHKVSKKVQAIETFQNGTGTNNTIKLSKYPFVDYDQINSVDSFDPNENGTDKYHPIEVYLKDSTITTGDGQNRKDFYPASYAGESEFVTINKTDYKNSRDISLKKYSIVPETAYKNFEYKQEKNKLVFTESFNRADLYYNEATNHGNAAIEVKYDYLVTKFRFKIILRKNSGDDLVVTPMVNSYQLKFKIMK